MTEEIIDIENVLPKECILLVDKIALKLSELNDLISELKSKYDIDLDNSGDDVNPVKTAVKLFP